MRKANKSQSEKPFQKPTTNIEANHKQGGTFRTTKQLSGQLPLTVSIPTINSEEIKRREDLMKQTEQQRIQNNISTENKASPELQAFQEIATEASEAINICIIS